MNTHQALQQIQIQREREMQNPHSQTTRKWASPVADKSTKRRQLTLNAKTPCKGLRGRGPLTIGTIDHKGGYESIVKRSISIQVDQMEKMLESRIEEFKQERSS
tara:strand:+ start:164 stop:475 length:312 start_codon:yes stop_codon:yes gene_type:complete